MALKDGIFVKIKDVRAVPSDLRNRGRNLVQHRDSFVLKRNFVLIHSLLVLLTIKAQQTVVHGGAELNFVVKICREDFKEIRNSSSKTR